MSDIPTLQWLVDWANVGIVAALVASLVFGAASIFLSKRLNRSKDEQATHEKQLSDEKIASLTAEAETAKKERAQADLKIEEAKARASQADERAASVELRAQEIERQNLELRSGVAGLEKEAANARAEQQRIQTELAKQEERAAEAERKLVEAVREVARRTAARYVDKEKLVAALKGKFDNARVEILYRAHDEDASLVAWQLYHDLGKEPGGVGWDVSEPKLIPEPDDMTDPRWPKFKYANGAGGYILIPHDMTGVMVIHPEKDWFPVVDAKTPGGPVKDRCIDS
jgi:hypothetical protein